MFFGSVWLPCEFSPKKWPTNTSQGRNLASDNQAKKREARRLETGNWARRKVRKRWPESALPGWLAKVHYSPRSAAGCNKCSRKPQPRVVQLNTGNNGHHSSSSSSSSTAPLGGGWKHTGSDRMQETLAQHLGLLCWPTKFRGGKELGNGNIQPGRSRWALLCRHIKWRWLWGISETDGPGQWAIHLSANIFGEGTMFCGGSLGKRIYLFIEI